MSLCYAVQPQLQVYAIILCVAVCDLVCDRVSIKAILQLHDLCYPLLVLLHCELLNWGLLL